jgi:hypothetical protein
LKIRESGGAAMIIKMAKLFKWIALFLLSAISLIFLINMFYRMLVDDDMLIIITPYASNMEIVYRDRPNKVYVIKQSSSDASQAEKQLLTDKPEEIEQLISDLKWTWATNLRKYPAGEESYEIRFENESGLVYPLSYYPVSDVILFPGHESVVSLHSSDKLKRLWYAFQ